MKQIILVIALLISCNFSFSQETVKASLPGKWNFNKIKMEMDFDLDMDHLDSSYHHFFDITRKHRRKTVLSNSDSIGPNRDFQAMKSHFEKSYIQFNADSTYITNFFSDQEEYQKGKFIYKPSTNEVLLMSAEKVLNYSLTTIASLDTKNLTFKCTLQQCDVLTVTFKKQ